jgi:hypothetical protein
MASAAAPPLSRRVFLYVVKRAPNKPADSCDAAFATGCVDPGVDETHVELIFTVPCLGEPMCSVPHLHTISDLTKVTHRIGKTHLVSFRVVRSTIWSALPPWLWKLFGVVFFPIFALLSLLSCSNAFPCGKYGVKRESRAHMAGGVQIIVDRGYDGLDRFALYEIPLQGDNHKQRDDAFLWMLAQGPEAMPTDDYRCCVPGYNYRGCVGIGLMGLFQWCCGRRCAAACCTSGLRAQDVAQREAVDEVDDEVELNAVAGEAGAGGGAGAGASDETRGLIETVITEKRRQIGGRCSLTCSEAVAAALVHGAYLEGLDPRALTPHGIYEALRARNLLAATVIDDVRAGRGGGRLEGA